MEYAQDKTGETLQHEEVCARSSARPHERLITAPITPIAASSPMLGDSILQKATDNVSL